MKILIARPQATSSSCQNHLRKRVVWKFDLLGVEAVGHRLTQVVLTCLSDGSDQMATLEPVAELGDLKAVEA